MSTVYVAHTNAALTLPQFIIKIPDPVSGTDIYYFTLAIWEYSIADAGTDPVKVAGCNAIALEFLAGATVEAVKRHVPTGGDDPPGTQTTPGP